MRLPVGSSTGSKHRSRAERQALTAISACSKELFEVLVERQENPKDGDERAQGIQSQYGQSRTYTANGILRNIVDKIAAFLGSGSNSLNSQEVGDTWTSLQPNGRSRRWITVDKICINAFEAHRTIGGSRRSTEHVNLGRVLCNH